MFLYKKVKKGIEYFYLRQTKRVKGKVVCEFQIYIGNKDKLYEVIQNGLNPIANIIKPESSEVLHFGSVAALVALLHKLNAFQIIDSVCIKRKQDMPMSYYLLIAAINRCIQAKSKNSIGPWIKKTSLPNLLKNLSPQKFTSQHFWNHMNNIDVNEIEKIEDALAKAVVEEYNLDLDSVLFDSTNFYSYIHSFNNNCTIEQRGKNKQNRLDLRQANFALLVTKEHHIPLYHRVYAGNNNDYTAFQDMIVSLKKKRDLLLGKSDDKKFTLVFDSGNVSNDNIELINKYKLQFISKLKPSCHKDLLNIPLSKYKIYKNENTIIKFHKTTKKVYGNDHLIVIKYSKNHFDAEYATLCHQTKEIELQLKLLSKRLSGYIQANKLPSNVTIKSVGNNVNDIFKNRTSLKTIFNVEIKKVNEKFLTIKWSFSQSKLKKHTETYLGKTIYFSNILNLEPEEIIETYSCSYQIEEIFKVSKNRNHGCWWPKFHWTDQKIKVHAFYCFISLLLTSVLQLEARRSNIALDIHSILDELHNIYEIIDTMENDNGKTFSLRRHSTLNKIQKTLFKQFELNDHFK